MISVSMYLIGFAETLVYQLKAMGNFWLVDLGLGLVSERSLLRFRFLYPSNPIQVLEAPILQFGLHHVA